MLQVYIYRGHPNILPIDLLMLICPIGSAHERCCIQPLHFLGEHSALLQIASQKVQSMNIALGEVHCGAVRDLLSFWLAPAAQRFS